MRRLATLAFCLLLSVVAVVPALAAPHADVINIPIAAAVVDGVISPGEWDGATELKLNFIETREESEYGAGIVGGTPPDNHTNDDISVSVRFMLKDGYLYLLETRKDSTLVFTRDDAVAPYASDGSIVFFCKRGENLNTSDIFIMARGRTIPDPMFEVRLNNGASQGPITPAAAKATITKDTFVLEAKIDIADLENVTEDDFMSGDLLVTYCAVNIIDLNFDGETSGLWGDHYQLQYKGVTVWDESPPIKVVKR